MRWSTASHRPVPAWWSPTWWCPPSRRRRHRTRPGPPLHLLVLVLTATPPLLGPGMSLLTLTLAAMTLMVVSGTVASAVLVGWRIRPIGVLERDRRLRGAGCRPPCSIAVCLLGMGWFRLRERSGVACCEEAAAGTRGSRR
jgi:hypothetical protein